MNRERPLNYALFLFVLLTIGLQILAFGPLRSTMWGVHLWAFFPPFVAPLGWLVVLTVAAVLLLRSESVPVPKMPAGLARHSPPTWARWTVAVVVTAMALWALRSRQDLLGDALPLTRDLPRGVDTHPRQPLTQWLQHALYQLLGPIFASPDLTPREVAARTVATGSVFCGLLYLPVARGLARALTSSLEDRTTTRLVFALLCAQGWILLFFGYLENYTFVLLTLSFFVWALLEAIQARWPLWPAALALSLAIALHLSALLLAPALWLAAIQVGRPHDRRLGAARDLLVGLAALVALGWLLQRHDPSFHLLSAARQLLGLASEDQGGGAGLSYLLSARHGRDWLNEQVLLGPVGALLWLLCLPWILRLGRQLDVTIWLLIAASTLVVGAHFITAEPTLGYARDWDLFAPTAVVVAVAALAFLVRLLPAPSRRRALVALLVLAMWDTGSWIVLNASETRSLHRFEHLPLGQGRTEVAVGNWYLRHGEIDRARTWLERAQRRSPTNSNAYFILATIESHEKNTDRAVALLGRAIRLRPRKPEYHEKLVQVLEEAGRPAEAATALDRWMSVDPGDADRWYRLATLRFQAGLRQPATEAMRRAASLYESEWKQGRQSVARAVRLGDLYAGLSELDRAREWYEKGLGMKGAQLAHARLAALAVSEGDTTVARRHLERAWAGDLGRDERDRLRAIAARLGIELKDSGRPQ